MTPGMSTTPSVSLSSRTWSMVMNVPVLPTPALQRWGNSTGVHKRNKISKLGLRSLPLCKRHDCMYTQQHMINTWEYCRNKKSGPHASSNACTNIQFWQDNKPSITTYKTLVTLKQCQQPCFFGLMDTIKLHLTYNVPVEDLAEPCGLSRPFYGS